MYNINIMLEKKLDKLDIYCIENANKNSTKTIHFCIINLSKIYFKIFKKKKKIKQ